jgi:DNA-binding XRE family transcriptional regulator
MNYAISIQALRSGRNWTQGDLAKRIGGGIANQSVSGWEWDRQAAPRKHI